MLYVGHTQSPTSVRHAIKSNFIQPNIPSLILAKHSSLEVHKISPDSLEHIFTIPILGTIEHIQTYTKPNNLTSTLLILTSDLNLFTIRYDRTTDSIVTTGTRSLSHASNRLADYLLGSVVDHENRCVLVHALNGILHLIPLVDLKSQSKPTDHPISDDSKNDRELEEIIEIRLNEVNVHSLSFINLTNSTYPTLSIIYSNHLGQRVLRLRQLDLIRTHCDQDVCQPYACEDPETGLVIEIEQGTILLVGEESVECVRLVERERKEKERDRSMDRRSIEHNKEMVVIGQRCKLPLGSYTCYCKVDDQKDAWILGDLYGNLQLIRLERTHTSSSSRSNIRIVATSLGGRVSSPESLVYITNSYLYLASHYGDCQLLRIVDVDGQAEVEVIQEFTNLAPISDVCVMNELDGFDYDLVTCSGAYQDGSLRIITNGIRVEDHGMIEIEKVSRIWSIVDDDDDHRINLILGFEDHTRILSLNAKDTGMIEEIDRLDRFKLDRRTILAGQIRGSGKHQRLSVQVTREEVIIGDRFVWEPIEDHSITVAALGASLTVVALQREVLLLYVKDGLLVQTESICCDDEVSCMAIDSDEGIIGIGQWKTNSILIVQIQRDLSNGKLEMRIMGEIQTGSSFGIGSLIFQDFSNPRSEQEKLKQDRDIDMLIGMDDGYLICTRLDPDRLVELGKRRKVRVGPCPVKMSSVPLGLTSGKRDGVWIHSEENPMLVSLGDRDDRLKFDTISIKSARLATRLGDTTLLTILTQDGIRLGEIKSLDKLHFDKICLNSSNDQNRNTTNRNGNSLQPRRIVHSKLMRAFGVICMELELDQVSGELKRFGSVKILDDSSFQVLYNFPLLTVEQGTSISVIELGGSHDSDPTKRQEHFIVGTGIVRTNELQPSSGRILAISVNDVKKDDRVRKFGLQRMTKVAGAVQGLGGLPNGRFVASANAFVHVFEVDEEEEGGFKLLDTWGGGFVSQTILTEKNWVLVGDLYKSIVLLEFVEEHRKHRLRVLGRDYSAMSVRPIGIVDERTFVGGDTEFNLFMVQMNEKRIEVEMDEEVVEDTEMDEWEMEERKMRVEKVFNDDHLLCVSGFHLGENVNHFRKGSFMKGQRNFKDERFGRRKLIFVSSTGGIGVILKVDDSKVLKVLETFEGQLKKGLKGVGDLDHSEWRSFKSKMKQMGPSRGFLDGDLLQSWYQNPSGFEHLQSEFKDDDQEVEKVKELVEELSWFH